MWSLRRTVWCCGLALLAVPLLAQVTINTDPPEQEVADITPAGLWDRTARVAGQGFEVPGIDITSGRYARHVIGDSAVYALPSFADTAWASVSSSEDSVVPGATVHWVRYHLKADEAVGGKPLLLNIQARGRLALFLNGTELLRATVMNVPGTWTLADSVGRLSVPLTLTGGGNELLALRLETDPGLPLSRAALQVSIHAADNGYHLNSVVTNYGVFIGINILILLMALVMGWSEKKRTGWLLLAALSLCTVLDTICVLGGAKGALGWPAPTARFLELFRLITVPWGMYLLIMVLFELRGELTRKRAKAYGWSIAVITLAAIMLMVVLLSQHPGQSIVLAFDQLNGVMQGLLSFLLVGIGFTAGVKLLLFGIAEVRLGLRLWRTKGYERWVGAGAVAASLLSFLLGGVGGFFGIGLSSWLSVLADYCSFAAVPVSVAIYLAIRSAHHTHLVTRQRDDLDLEVQERTAELRSEKERSDELLHNILPHEVAEELKHTGGAAARHYDQATVLFSDFRGFTQLSEKLPPEELVRQVDMCFRHFDGLMDKWHMEKIKTIGDSYMAAGGLPDPAKGSPADVVHAALEMQDFMEALVERRKAQGLPVFRMRVGIHTGPVVAGIVGVKKFQYDIWGDTVNTASRMESSGEVGQVNISEATYKLLVVSSQLSGHSPTTNNQQLTTPAFHFTPRGKVQAKGKGEMEMYFVHRSSEGA